MTFSYNIICLSENYSYTVYLLNQGPPFDLLPFWLITIRMSRYYIIQRDRERGDKCRERDRAHRQGPLALFSSSAFCWNKHFHCNAPVTPPLPFLLNVVSLSHIPLLFLTLTLCSLFLFLYHSLCPSVFGRYSSFPQLSTPAVTPWPGYTIRSSLLANTQTRRQTKAVCAFFVVHAPLPSIYLSLSPGTF